MGFLIAGFILLALLTQIPNLWTHYILKKYQTPDPEIPGTGGQFAEHLIRKYQLPVTLEETAEGDHYDPIQKVVRLSSANTHTNSLTAIATAAHEVGHALQDHEGYEPLQQRIVLIQRSQWLQKFSGIALMATPVLIPLLHTPIIGLVTFGAGFIAMGVPVIIHLSTLPVEFDASFNRALPLLKEGNYLTPKQHKIARRILLACALTYVSASLASLFNLWKWLQGVRR
jgi:Zn-dependent membrane protease YugP